MPKPLALTCGEPAGIGPDITLQAWLQRGTLNLPPFYVLADAAHLARRAQALGLDVPIATVAPAEAMTAFGNALPVVGGIAATAPPGRPDGSSAQAAIASIRRAVAAVQQGEAAAIVTNPIAKHVLYQAGFRHPGHTEFLAELAAIAPQPAPRSVMMLWSPALATVPVTIHLPLREAITLLSTELIVETGRVVVTDLRDRFGIQRPRLAVSGLNPHAGEDGALGTEDQAIIAPAVAALRSFGCEVLGPLPADTMFHAAARANYDCAVCMYHDQALIPIKTLAFEDAVNVTLGLPFIRTSPDHGTAFDMAGTGRANPSSLVAALKLAARMAATGSAR